MKFAIATNNINKLKEFQSILGALGHQALSLSEIGIFEDIEESGSTFEENAVIKAEAVMLASGLPTIADDSGLEVEALNMEPGIYSARYSAPGTRKQKILDEMIDVPKNKRGARFVSAIACIFPGGERIVTRGECYGEILFECRGDGGFGYDPLFYIPEYGLTFAEMNADLKNKISHRAKALEKLTVLLKGR